MAFQIPKSSGRTTVVKSMASEVSLLGLKFWLCHLVTITLVSSCEMENKKNTYLVGLFYEF